MFDLYRKQKLQFIYQLLKYVLKNMLKFADISQHQVDCFFFGQIRIVD